RTPPPLPRSPLPLSLPYEAAAATTATRIARPAAVVGTGPTASGETCPDDEGPSWAATAARAPTRGGELCLRPRKAVAVATAVVDGRAAGFGDDAFGGRRETLWCCWCCCCCCFSRNLLPLPPPHRPDARVSRADIGDSWYSCSSAGGAGNSSRDNGDDDAGLSGVPAASRRPPPSPPATRCLLLPLPPRLPPPAPPAVDRTGGMS
ncbi:unnamed protein product, partial [Ectocarpus sp. 8 AP-2014]